MITLLQRAAPRFDQLVDSAPQRHNLVADGQFGAMMQVELINDGPATFWLQTKPGSGKRKQ